MSAFIVCNSSIFRLMYNDRWLPVCTMVFKSSCLCIRFYFLTATIYSFWVYYYLWKPRYVLLVLFQIFVLLRLCRCVMLLKESIFEFFSGHAYIWNADVIFLKAFCRLVISKSSNDIAPSIGYVRILYEC